MISTIATESPFEGSQSYMQKKVSVYVRSKIGNSPCFVSAINEISHHQASFYFDRVFEKESNFELFKSTTVDLLEHFWKGFDVTYFCYGQTGSGKTYSLGMCENQVSDFLNNLSEFVAYSPNSDSCLIYTGISQKVNMVLKGGGQPDKEGKIQIIAQNDVHAVSSQVVASKYHEVSREFSDCQEESAYSLRSITDHNASARLPPSGKNSGEIYANNDQLGSQMHRNCTDASGTLPSTNISHQFLSSTYYQSNFSHFGVIHHSLLHIFMNKSLHDRVFLSFVEIYNEQCFDLLSPYKAHLTIQASDGQNKLNAREIEVVDIFECLKTLHLGLKERTVKSTLMNMASSRSHAILTVIYHRASFEDEISGLDSQNNESAGNSSFRLPINTHMFEAPIGESIPEKQAFFMNSSAEKHHPVDTKPEKSPTAGAKGVKNNNTNPGASKYGDIGQNPGKSGNIIRGGNRPIIAESGGKIPGNTIQRDNKHAGTERDIHIRHNNDRYIQTAGYMDKENCENSWKSVQVPNLRENPEPVTVTKPPAHFRVSKFTFVDLAGSERLKKSFNKQTTIKESISINSGLLSLSNVITALSKKQKYIPYRDSKLTRILQHSLGGNSLTTMLATMSNCASNVNESLNTLKYAVRASSIQNEVCMNKRMDLSGLSVVKLQSELLSLKNENLELKREIKNLSTKKEGRKVEELLSTIQDLKSQIEILKSERYKVESTIRSVELSEMENKQLRSQIELFNVKVTELEAIRDANEKVIIENRQLLERLKHAEERIREFRGQRCTNTDSENFSSNNGLAQEGGYFTNEQRCDGENRFGNIASEKSRPGNAHLQQTSHFTNEQRCDSENRFGNFASEKTRPGNAHLQQTSHFTNEQRCDDDVRSENTTPGNSSGRLTDVNHVNGTRDSCLKNYSPSSRKFIQKKPLSPRKHTFDLPNNSIAVNVDALQRNMPNVSFSALESPKFSQAINTHPNDRVSETKHPRIKHISSLGEFLLQENTQGIKYKHLNDKVEISNLNKYKDNSLLSERNSQSDDFKTSQNRLSSSKNSSFRFSERNDTSNTDLSEGIKPLWGEKPLNFVMNENIADLSIKLNRSIEEDISGLHISRRSSGIENSVNIERSRIEPSISERPKNSQDAFLSFNSKQPHYSRQKQPIQASINQNGLSEELLLNFQHSHKKSSMDNITHVRAQKPKRMKQNFITDQKLQNIPLSMKNDHKSFNNSASRTNLGIQTSMVENFTNESQPVSNSIGISLTARNINISNINTPLNTNLEHESSTARSSEKRASIFKVFTHTKEAKATQTSDGGRKKRSSFLRHSKNFNGDSESMNKAYVKSKSGSRSDSPIQLKERRESFYDVLRHIVSKGSESSVLKDTSGECRVVAGDGTVPVFRQVMDQNPSSSEAIFNTIEPSKNAIANDATQAVEIPYNIPKQVMNQKQSSSEAIFNTIEPSKSAIANDASQAVEMSYNIPKQVMNQNPSSLESNVAIFNTIEPNKSAIAQDASQAVEMPYNIPKQVMNQNASNLQSNVIISNQSVELLDSSKNQSPSNSNALKSPQPESFNIPSFASKGIGDDSPPVVKMDNISFESQVTPSDTARGIEYIPYPKSNVPTVFNKSETRSNAVLEPKMVIKIPEISEKSFNQNGVAGYNTYAKGTDRAQRTRSISADYCDKPSANYVDQNARIQKQAVLKLPRKSLVDLTDIPGVDDSSFHEKVYEQVARESLKGMIDISGPQIQSDALVILNNRSNGQSAVQANTQSVITAKRESSHTKSADKAIINTGNPQKDCYSQTQPANHRIENGSLIKRESVIRPCNPSERIVSFDFSANKNMLLDTSSNESLVFNPRSSLLKLKTAILAPLDAKSGENINRYDFKDSSAAENNSNELDSLYKNAQSGENINQYDFKDSFAAENNSNELDSLYKPRKALHEILNNDENCQRNINSESNKSTFYKQNVSQRSGDFIQTPGDLTSDTSQIGKESADESLSIDFGRKDSLLFQYPHNTAGNEGLKDSRIATYGVPEHLEHADVSEGDPSYGIKDRVTSFGTENTCDTSKTAISKRQINPETQEDAQERIPGPNRSTGGIKVGNKNTSFTSPQPRTVPERSDNGVNKSIEDPGRLEMPQVPDTVPQKSSKLLHEQYLSQFRSQESESLGFSPYRVVQDALPSMETSFIQTSEYMNQELITNDDLYDHRENKADTPEKSASMDDRKVFESFRNKYVNNLQNNGYQENAKK